MLTGPTDIAHRQSRLDTWKSIAHYLGRCNRTVQRWHSELGLPIHHLSGNSGSVFAYPEELDAWLRSRSQPVQELPGDLRLPAARRAYAGADELDRSTEIFSHSAVEGSAKSRSAQLVAFAYRRWEILSNESLSPISRHFREAIDLDPDNASAYAGLALSLIAGGAWGALRPCLAYASAQAALEIALRLSPDLPHAKCAAAWLKVLSARDWKGARREFDTILAGTHASTYCTIGRGALHIAEGELASASALLLEAARQFPLSSGSIALYCWTEYLGGNFTAALDQLDQIRASGRCGPMVNAVEALALVQSDGLGSNLEQLEALAEEFPGQDLLKGALGYAYAVAGQSLKAREMLDSMVGPAGRRMGCDAYSAALVLIGLRERQKAMHCLEQSYREGSLWSLGFLSDPILDSVRNDPHTSLYLDRLSYPNGACYDLRLRTAG